MNNNKEFVPYEIALKLKELGFDEDVLFHWFPDYSSENDNRTYHLEYGKNYIGVNEKNIEILYKEGLYQLIIPAPLWQQAFEWLREKHNYLYLITDVKVSASDTEGYRFKYQIWKLDNDDFYIDDESFLGSYDYNEAQQTCLLAILNNLKNNKNEKQN